MTPLVVHVWRRAADAQHIGPLQASHQLETEFNPRRSLQSTQADAIML
jgi:hypothetical protein